MDLKNLKKWLATYDLELQEAIGDARSLLDIGCGIASPLARFERKPEKTVGVDGFMPSIEESRRRGIHDDYVCCDILEVGSKFPAGSFECVMALDVIEHLPKEKGLDLLRQMEQVSSRRVIIFTPNGFLAQAEHSNNPLQVHLSGWSVKEMREMGFRVIGINGWKPLLGEMALPRLRPMGLWAVVSRLTQYLVRDNPEHAFQILCVKDKL
jgi:SAM-dependent methyltransferase